MRAAAAITSITMKGGTSPRRDGCNNLRAAALFIAFEPSFSFAPVFRPPMPRSRRIHAV
jgi:hypothetical protein